MPETVSFDSADPGPVLPSYDPRWEARFDAARAALEAHQQADGEGCLDRHSHERCQALFARMKAAYEAQFEHAWQYEAYVRSTYRIAAERAGLRLPDLAYTAGVEDIREAYRRFGDLCSTVTVLRSMEPVREWGGGLFAQEAPRGIEREISHEVLELRHPRDVPLHTKLIVERHGTTVHVCAIQHPHRAVPSVFGHREFLAERLAERHLPPRRRRDALLRRPPRGRLFLYCVQSISRHDGPRQDVWPHEVTWARRASGHVVELQPRRLRDATPLIRRETLMMQPELRAAVQEQEQTVGYRGR